MKTHLLPLRAMRAFESAARHLSFKKASDELCVTPAAISHQIRSIEQYLGVQLFIRLNRTITLTVHGKRCLDEISQGFIHLSRALSLLTADKQNTKRLVISSGPAFASKWLIPRLTKFSNLQPEIQTSVIASLDLADLLNDQIDVAIRFGKRPEVSIYAECLLEEMVVPLCSPTLKNQTGEPPSLDNLAEFKLIHDESLNMIDSQSMGWPEWLDRFNMPHINLAHGLRFNHADHALQAAIEGNGIVLGRRVLAALDLQSGRLIIPFGQAIPSKLHFYFVCTHDKIGMNTVKVFHDWLFEELQNLPDCPAQQNKLSVQLS